MTKWFSPSCVLCSGVDTPSSISRSACTLASASTNCQQTGFGAPPLSSELSGSWEFVAVSRQARHHLDQGTEHVGLQAHPVSASRLQVSSHKEQESVSAASQLARLPLDEETDYEELQLCLDGQCLALRRDWHVHEIFNVLNICGTSTVFCTTS